MSPHTEYTQIQTDFLKELRERTAPQHAQLEKNELSAALMSPGVTMQDYARYLSYMYQVIAYAETTLFPVVQGVIDSQHRIKLPAIAADLVWLQTVPVNSAFQLPTSGISVAQAMGYLYVIEGSTLGGRVIIKHIQKTILVTEKEGAAFFNGYGADTGKQWTHFLQAFVAYATTHHCEQVMIESAAAAFQAISDFFSRKLPA